MDGRKATGGKLEVKVKIREPLSAVDLQPVTEKWLVLEPVSSLSPPERQKERVSRWPTCLWAVSHRAVLKTEHTVSVRIQDSVKGSVCYNRSACRIIKERLKYHLTPWQYFNVCNVLNPTITHHLTQWLKVCRILTSLYSSFFSHFAQLLLALIVCPTKSNTMNAIRKDCPKVLVAIQI